MKPSPVCRDVPARGLIGTCRPNISDGPISGPGVSANCHEDERASQSLRCDGEGHDGIAEGLEEGTCVLARLVQNPDRTRIGAVDPLDVAGPRPMSARPNADADEVEGSIGTGCTCLHRRDDGDGCVARHGACQGAGDEGKLGVSRWPRRAATAPQLQAVS